MPALNFQKRFAEDVRTGKKRQTIRTVRKHPIKVGDALYLYTGMRTKQCVKLCEGRCWWVMPIKISRHPTTGGGVLRNQSGASHLLDEFAQADGFDSAEDMLNWFEQTHGLPFRGVLIRW